MKDIPIKDAATVLLIRGHGDARSVLMGQRGRNAVFMPGKFVFPGGGVEAGDLTAPSTARLSMDCNRRLGLEAPPDVACALPMAALRELTEETGLGLKPDASLRFAFRAVTPPARPRRFDARFFVVDAGEIAGDPDDFSRAEGELSHLQWVPLAAARDFDLPFVTRIVLAEVTLTDLPNYVPFYDHRGPVGRVRALR